MVCAGECAGCFPNPQKQPAPFCTDILRAEHKKRHILRESGFKPRPKPPFPPCPTLADTAAAFHYCKRCSCCQQRRIIDVIQRLTMCHAWPVELRGRAGEKFYAQIFAVIIGDKVGTVLVQQRQRAAHILKKGNADKQVKRRHGRVLCYGWIEIALSGWHAAWKNGLRFFNNGLILG